MKSNFIHKDVVQLLNLCLGESKEQQHDGDDVVDFINTRHHLCGHPASPRPCRPRTRSTGRWPQMLCWRQIWVWYESRWVLTETVKSTQMNGSSPGSVLYLDQHQQLMRSVLGLGPSVSWFLCNPPNSPTNVDPGETRTSSARGNESSWSVHQHSTAHSEKSLLRVPSSI